MMSPPHSSTTRNAPTGARHESAETESQNENPLQSRGLSQPPSPNSHSFSSTSSIPARPLRVRIAKWFDRQLERLGLDWFTLFIFLKAGLPPAIVLALLQIHRLALMLSPIGYLSAMVSIFSFPHQPYLKVIQLSVYNLIGIAALTLVNMFAAYTIVRARVSTTPAGQMPPPSTSPWDMPYNASAATVAAVWLFLEMYTTTVIRTKYAALRTPAVLASIFGSFTLTTGHRWGSMTTALSLLGRYLLVFTLGTATSLAVSVLIFPTTSRHMVRRLMTQFASMAALLIAELVTFFRLLEDPILKESGALLSSGDNDDDDYDDDSRESTKSQTTSEHKDKTGQKVDSQTIKSIMMTLLRLHTKLSQEIPFAKREITWSQVGSVELTTINRLLRDLHFVLVELGSVVDVIERIKRQGEHSGNLIHDEDERDGESFFLSWRIYDRDSKRQMTHCWSRLLVRLLDPIDRLAVGMIYVLDHFLLVFKFKGPDSDHLPSKGPKVARLIQASRYHNTTIGAMSSAREGKGIDDIESEAGLPPSPGDPDFMLAFDRLVMDFADKREELLRTWMHEDHNCNFHGSSPNQQDLSPWHHSLISLFLFVHSLFHSTAVLVGRVGHYADKLRNDGTLDRRRRLIFPATKQLKKWFRETILGADHTETDTYHDSGARTGLTRQVKFNNGKISDADVEVVRSLSQSLRQKRKRERRKQREKVSEKRVTDGKKRSAPKGASPADNLKPRDPEHLPPTNWIESFGDHFRQIGHFFASPESGTGFRVACAVMSVGILAFIHQTTRWFQSERAIWGLMIVLLAMTPTAGESISNFVIRLFGTFISIVITFLVWYIPGGKTWGILVFLWLAQALGVGLMLKQPMTLPGVLTGSVTVVIIIGYRLQLNVVDENVIRAAQQPVYPIYILAPYRGLVVIIAILVAFFWTMFPFPVSDRFLLRRRLSDSLYLLSTYYTLVHTAIVARARGEDADGDLSGLQQNPNKKQNRTGVRPRPSASATNSDADDEGSEGGADENDDEMNEDLDIERPITPPMEIMSAQSPANKVRVRICSRLSALTGQAYQTLGLVSWEIPVGGKFPKAQYVELLGRVMAMTTYLTLMEHASATYHSRNKHPISKDMLPGQQTPSSGNVFSTTSPSSGRTSGQRQTGRPLLQPRSRSHVAYPPTMEDLPTGSSSRKINISTSSFLPSTAEGGKVQLTRPGSGLGTVRDEAAENMALAYCMVIDALGATSQKIVSQTALLAGYLANGQALPPFFHSIANPPVLYFIKERGESEGRDDDDSFWEVERLGSDAGRQRRRLSLGRGGGWPLREEEHWPLKAKEGSQSDAVFTIPTRSNSGRVIYEHRKVGSGGSGSKGGAGESDACRLQQSPSPDPETYDTTLVRATQLGPSISAASNNSSVFTRNAGRDKRSTEIASAAAVLTIASACVHEDFLRMRRAVGEILGEMDVGFWMPPLIESEIRVGGGNGSADGGGQRRGNQSSARGEPRGADTVCRGRGGTADGANGDRDDGSGPRRRRNRLGRAKRRGSVESIQRKKGEMRRSLVESARLNGDDESDDNDDNNDDNRASASGRAYDSIDGNEARHPVAMAFTSGSTVVADRSQSRSNDPAFSTHRTRGGSGDVSNPRSRSREPQRGDSDASQSTHTAVSSAGISRRSSIRGLTPARAPQSQESVPPASLSDLPPELSLEYASDLPPIVRMTGSSSLAGSAPSPPPSIPPPQIPHPRAPPQRTSNQYPPSSFPLQPEHGPDWGRNRDNRPTRGTLTGSRRRRQDTSMSPRTLRRDSRRVS